MAEKIGVEGRFETEPHFSRGLKTYLDGLNKAQRETKSASSSMTNLGKGFGDLSKLGSGTMGVIGGLGGAILEVGKKAAMVAAGGLALFTAGVVGATAATTAFIAGGVTKAANLEQKMADIAAVMGKTFQQTLPLKNLINELSINPNLKVNTEEAAGAIEMLARNGVEMADIMNGAAESTVLLANATDADFGTAADVATDAMVIFNKTAEELGSVVDGATGVVTNSKFSIDDYRLALARAGGIAAASGVSIEDFNTVIAASASNFSSGSDAGTSFKVFLQRLIPQSKEAAEAMRRVGLFTGQTGKEFEKTQEKIAKVDEQIGNLDPTSKNYAKRLKELEEKRAKLTKALEVGNNAFYDENGNMRDMIDVAGLLKNAFGDLSEEKRSDALATIFGTDASNFAVALMNKEEGQLRSLASEVNKVNQAQESAKTRMDTFSGAMEVLSGILDSVHRQIGDMFLPTLKDLAKGAAEFAEKAAPKVLEFFQKMADRLNPLIQAMLPKVIEFFQRFGPVVGRILNKVIDLVIEFSPTFGRMFESAANGIETFLGLIEKYAPNIKGFLGGAIDTVANLLDMFTRPVSKGGGFLEILQFSGLSGLATRLGLRQEIVPQIQAFGKALMELGQIAMTWVKPAFEAIVSAGPMILDTINRLIVAFSEGGLSGVFSEFGQMAQEAWATIGPVLADLGNQLVQNIIGPAIANLPDMFNQFLDVLIGFVDQNLPTIQANFARWSEAILAFADTAVEKVGDVLGALVVAIGAWVSSDEGQGKLLTLGETLGTALVTGLDSLLSNQAAINETMAKMAAALAGAATALTVELIAIGAQVTAGILAGILESLGAGEFQAATFNELGQVLSGIGENLKTIVAYELGENIMAGIKAGIEKAQQWVQDALITGINAAIDAFKSLLGISSPSTVFSAFGTNLMEGLIEGIRSMIGSISGVLGEVGGAIIEGASSIFGEGGLFGGLFGGGEGGESVSLAQLPLIIEQVTFGLMNLATVTMPMLNQALMTFAQNFITQFTTMQQWIMLVDFGLTNIYAITFPMLLAQSTAFIMSTLAGFTSINTLIVQTTTNLAETIAKFTELQSVSKKTTDQMIKGFKTVKERIDDATESTREFITALQEAVSQAQALATAAGGISIGGGGGGGGGFASVPGVSAASGIGRPFQSGSDGIQKVPSGGLLARMHPGEEYAIAPRGQSLMGMIAGAGSGGQAAPSINFYGPITISDQIGLDKFAQRIKKEVAAGF